MPKSHLRVKPHSVLPETNVVEIWYNGEFVGEITGADRPGIRVISKHPMSTGYAQSTINILEVGIFNAR